VPWSNSTWISSSVTGGSVEARIPSSRNTLSVETLRTFVQPIAESASHLLGDPHKFSRAEILVNADFTGQGYAIMGEAEKEAILLFARTEGLLLDPVYTGRAAAGMLSLVRSGFFKAGASVLFWHTGGTPALFAQKYSQVLVQ